MRLKAKTEALSKATRRVSFSIAPMVRKISIKPNKFVGASLVLFILSSILLIGAQGITLFDRFSRSTEVGLDNRVWLFAQLEVEAKNFGMSLLTALADGEPISPLEDAAIRDAFDIYYSRIRTVAAISKDVVTDELAVYRLNRLKTTSQELADQLDAVDLLTRPNVEKINKSFSADLPAIRKTANNGVLETIELAETEREGRHWIVGRLQIVMGIVIVLMIASVLQAMRVSRSVDQLAEESTNVASQLRRTFDASLDAIIVVDEQGVITEHNAALRNILAAAPDETFVGRDVRNFIANEDVGAIATLIRDLISDARPDSDVIASARRIYIKVQNVSGHEFPVELSCAAERAASGQFNFIVFIRDRSKEVAAADILRHARDQARLDAKAKERFLSVLSHEMRTPLHGVMASLELIHDAGLPPGDQGFLATAHACAKSALTQVDDVLALTRNGHLGDTSEVFCPEAMIDEIVNEMVPLALERGNLIDFFVSGSAKGSAIMAKRRSFKLSVRNLISNAVKYTGNGRIDVYLKMEHADENGIEVQVTVKDSGIGISQNDQARIFEEFSMVADEGAEQRTGFGLGLAIAKSSVDRMQGTIKVESELGKGSRFSFRIVAPLATIERAEPAPAERPAIKSVTATTSRKILIVDDNPVNRALLSEMVKRLGHVPEVAQDGSTALNAARLKAFDLILLDLSMPGIDGFETAKQIRAGGANQSTPIFALTARDLVECRDEIKDCGMQGAYQKPIGMVELGHLVNNIERQAATAPKSQQFPLLEGFSEVLGLMGNDMMRRLLGGMVEDSHAAIDRLAGQALKSDQFEDLIDTAHRAGGSAAVTGATRLAETWRRVERAARAKDQAALASLAVTVPETLTQTLDALKRADHGSLV